MPGTYKERITSIPPTPILWQREDSAHSHKARTEILTSLCQNVLTLNVKNWFWSSLWMPGQTHTHTPTHTPPLALLILPRTRMSSYRVRLEVHWGTRSADPPKMVKHDVSGVFSQRFSRTRFWVLGRCRVLGVSWCFHMKVLGSISKANAHPHTPQRDLDKKHWCIPFHFTYKIMAPRTFNLGDSLFLYTRVRHLKIPILVLRLHRIMCDLGWLVYGCYVLEIWKP